MLSLALALVPLQLALPQAVTARPAPAPRRLVEVDLAAAPGRAPVLERLLASGLDVLPAGVPGACQVLADDAELGRLRGLGIPYRVVHEDLGAYYAERSQAAGPAPAPALGAWLEPPFGQGSMGGFYTWDEVASVLDQVHAAYPDLVSARASIGQSVEERDLWVVKVSDHVALDEDEPEVRFDALHHAREPQSMQTLLWTLLWLVENHGKDPLATALVDQRETWFVPVVNPDGYEFNRENAPDGGGLWRKNRRRNGGGEFGVDLNRNYPYQWGYDDLGSSPSKSSDVYRGPSPASEPETAAMVAFLAAHDFRTALSLHTFSDLWPYPFGYTNAVPQNVQRYLDVSARATELNGYRYGPVWRVLYFANGALADHEQANEGTLAWAPEIGGPDDGFWPVPARIAPLAEENREALLRTALAAGSYPYVADLAATDDDGDGGFEPGETVRLLATATNVGCDATATPVGLELVLESPWAAAGTRHAELDPLDAGASATAAEPFTLRVRGDARPGTEVRYAVRVSWEGFAFLDRRSFVIGRAVPLVADDLETDVGWQKGLPGDTATKGIWEWGNPKKTQLSTGVVASPEDDATPDPGVRCLITGNGSPFANVDDVDDGFTTLVSPRLDLSGVGGVRLSYSYWYVDVPVPDDALEVSISNDDGATWAPLDTIDETVDRWTRRSVLLGRELDLTDSVRLRFVMSDEPDNSTAEACVDELLVEAFDAVPRLRVYGRAETGGALAFHVSSVEGGPYGVLESAGTAAVAFPNVAGTLLLDPATLSLALEGTVPAAGLERVVVAIPDDPSLVGRTLWFQALVATPDGFALTNRQSVLFE